MTLNSNFAQKVPRLPEKINLPEEEKKILKYWREIKAFESSLKQSAGKPEFTFYDGPPFATGLPHYGHILTGTLKDTITRYVHQHGFHVERRFGWDTHGLPVEFAIDKLLKIKSPEDVIKMGLKQYNAECRKIVMKYSQEWEQITERLGRWTDFKNDYKTFYPWYMESVWWVFKQLYQKGLVYKGSKVMPYSTGCMTPLSNFESSQNYKLVTDPAITVSFPLVDDPSNAAILIWTTTPWTLPSNLAVCVHPALEYVQVRQVSTGNVYILLKDVLADTFLENDCVIVKNTNGNELKGLKYEPPFPYYKHLANEGAFVVLADSYVASESGTGIVHLAPYFGEDDYRVCLQAGIISREMDPICPLDSTGHFIKPVKDLEGQYFKDADKNIIAYLKDSKRLFQHLQITHSYPFCYRSDTPLIYRAVPSWFIRVEAMQQELLNVTAETHWVPDNIKEKRFGNWLKEAKDWAVSRNRYWGTPIPLWMSANGDEIRCIGSIAELEELSGKKLVDLHREYVDEIEVPSLKEGGLPLRRVGEIFDCWFESGCMPYAQQHYPFENPEKFENWFPADFVAEGIDQTRGWFYTLTVISTALFGKPPYKNVLVNGLIVAEDGQKMSKRKKNYPDPKEIFNKYGADALRLYLISSPAVKAENISFKEEGLKDIIKTILLPWYNACRFLMESIELYINKNQRHFKADFNNLNRTNITDCWIVSLLECLLQFIEKEMNHYRLYNIMSKIMKYMTSLTNWYIRLNRKRLRGESGHTDCVVAMTTLFNVTFKLTIIMAPYAPFMAENIYQYLKSLTHKSEDSIHFILYPKTNIFLLDPKTEKAVQRMQTIIELGRRIRDKKCIPFKCPLPELVIIHKDTQYLEDILSLKEYIISELNVRKINISTDKSEYGVTQKLEPNNKTLGVKLKKQFKNVAKEIKALSEHETDKMLLKGHINIGGHQIDINDVKLILGLENNMTHKYEVNSNNDVLVLMDITSDITMKNEGLARQIINFIQKLRKRANLVPTDQICVVYSFDGDLSRVFTSYKDFIQEAINAPFCLLNQSVKVNDTLAEDTFKISNCSLYISLIKI